MAVEIAYKPPDQTANLQNHLKTHVNLLSTIFSYEEVLNKLPIFITLNYSKVLFSGYNYIQ